MKNMKNNTYTQYNFIHRLFIISMVKISLKIIIIYYKKKVTTRMKSILAVAFVACLIGMSKMEDGNAYLFLTM